MPWPPAYRTSGELAATGPESSSVLRLLAQPTPKRRNGAQGRERFQLYKQALFISACPVRRRSVAVVRGGFGYYCRNTQQERNKRGVGGTHFAKSEHWLLFIVVCAVHVTCTGCSSHTKNRRKTSSTLQQKARSFGAMASACCGGGGE